jgi:protein-S-isoprenylcysteine O-methyltransferase
MTAGFAYASMRFFSDRIPWEEDMLVQLFGERYNEYRARTPTYIPYVK